MLLGAAFCRANRGKLSSFSFSTHRGPDPSHVEDLATILGGLEALVQDPDVLHQRNTDWKNQYCGSSSLLVRPNSVNQLSDLLRYCSKENLGVVPQGGNTGLVGGSVPIKNEIILSLERLNGIHGIDPFSGVLKCQAGCVLSDLQEYAQNQNLLVPVDLGAKGSCQIGGNISTNAGGQYYYRYGSLAANVVGLEVVLASGSILDLNFATPNLKDNTGYKLHQLFIGAEGTLGVVTGVALKCSQYPRSRQAIFVACPSYENVVEVLEIAKEELGETLAAFEWMDKAIMGLVSEQTKLPIDNGSSHYLLVETHGNNEEHDQSKMNRFLDLVMEKEVVVDGALAQDLSQVENFWRIRESCNPILAAQGYGYKYDVSLPISLFEEFCQEMQAKLGDLAFSANWGHVVDGNLHFNVTTIGKHDADSKVLSLLEPYLFEAVLTRGGSISAEHGLGQAKNHYLYMVHDEQVLSTMKNLKDLFDPLGILNPGKFLSTK